MRLHEILKAASGSQTFGPIEDIVDIASEMTRPCDHSVWHMHTVTSLWPGHLWALKVKKNALSPTLSLLGATRCSYRPGTRKLTLIMNMITYLGQNSSETHLKLFAILVQVQVHVQVHVQVQVRGAARDGLVTKYEYKYKYKCKYMCAA